MSRGNEVHDSKQGNRTDIEKKWENDEQKTIILSPSHLAHEGEEGTGAGTGKRAIARSKNQIQLLIARGIAIPSIHV